MSCPSIQGLVLDAESQRAVEEIRNKANLAKFMGSAVSIGVMVNIFSTRSSLNMAYNIYQTDFQSFSKSMAGIPVIYRGQVEGISARQHLRSIDYKQKVFWKAVHDGCRL